MNKLHCFEESSHLSPFKMCRIWENFFLKKRADAHLYFTSVTFISSMSFCYWVCVSEFFSEKRLKRSRASPAIHLYFMYIFSFTHNSPSPINIVWESTFYFPSRWYRLYTVLYTSSLCRVSFRFGPFAYSIWLENLSLSFSGDGVGSLLKCRRKIFNFQFSMESTIKADDYRTSQATLTIFIFLL